MPKYGGRTYLISCLSDISGVFERALSVRFAWLFWKMFLRNRVAIPEGRPVLKIVWCYYIGIYTTHIVTVSFWSSSNFSQCFRGLYNRSVSKVTGCWLGFTSGKGRIFLFATTSRSVLGPTQIPNQWLLKALSGAKAIGGWRWLATSIIPRLTRRFDERPSEGFPERCMLCVSSWELYNALMDFDGNL